MFTIDASVWVNADSPAEVDAFADAVYAAERADPHGNPPTRKQVRDCIAAHFANSSGTQ